MASPRRVLAGNESADERAQQPVHRRVRRYEYIARDHAAVVKDPPLAAAEQLGSVRAVVQPQASLMFCLLRLFVWELSYSLSDDLQVLSA